MKAVNQLIDNFAAWLSTHLGRTWGFIVGVAILSLLPAIFWILVLVIMR